MSWSAAPPVIKVAAGVFGGLAAANLVRTAVQVPMNLANGNYSDAGRALFLALNMIVVLLSLLAVLVAFHLVRGRIWAWVTAMVMLGVLTLFGLVFLLPQLINGDFPWMGLVVLVPSLGLLLALTVPRSARGHFTRKRDYSSPYQAPWPAGGNGAERPH
ncbi:hypothetical protein AB0M02_43785 [Actinoplanes sp. NPDC051861]|uniref:hypothetical protein n=1 Tax=Actinoplanes sp. NPDC051861 TaxID=3155170 RepID=UPI00343BC58C